MFCISLLLLTAILARYTLLTTLQIKQILRLLLHTSEEDAKSKRYTIDSITIDIMSNTVDFIKIVLILKYSLLFKLDALIKRLIKSESYYILYFLVFMVAESLF